MEFNIESNHLALATNGTLPSRMLHTPNTIHTRARCDVTSSVNLRLNLCVYTWIAYLGHLYLQTLDVPLSCNAYMYVL